MESARPSADRRTRKRELPVDGSGGDEVLDHLDDEEGSGGGALRLRPSRDYNRDELGAEATTLPVALSDLISDWFQDRFSVCPFSYFIFCSLSVKWICSGSEIIQGFVLVLVEI